MKSIYISKYVSSRLETLEGVTVGNMILPEDTPFPAVVFEKTQHPIEYDKEGAHSRVGYNFVVLAEAYKQALDISSSIVDILQNLKGDMDGLSIDYSRLQSIDEMVDEKGVYIVRLGWLFRFSE